MDRRTEGISRLVFGVAALAIVVGIGSATAGQRAATPSVSDRIEGAERVVVARARSVNARWQQNSHGDRLIVSRVMLQVEETLKGSAEQTLVMDVAGGTLDGVTLRVSGLPLMTAGDRAVFFLDDIDPALHTPHRQGDPILQLDDNDMVSGSSVRLNDIRALARGIARIEQERVR